MGALRLEYLIPLLLIALLVFGAKRLPEIGASAGKTIRSFQKAMSEGKDPADTPPALPPGQDEQATPHS